MTKANECTCPSGDGSLRHPCPAHPASVELAGVGAKLTFINGRPAMCGCQVEYSSGGGLVATNRIALTPEYEGQWHADFYLDREIPLAKAEGATPAEAVLALMSAERIDPEQESVEQAGGDERDLQGAQGERDGWGPLPIVQVPWNVFDRAVMWVEDRRRYGDDGTIVDDWKALKTIQRAALAQPSPKCEFCGGTGEISGVEGEDDWVNGPCPRCAYPAQAEQAEAERPEVVARVVHSNPVVLDHCAPLNANDELMTIAQHAASVARWAEMFNRVEQERDAALARVAELEAKFVELEKQEPVAYSFRFAGCVTSSGPECWRNEIECERPAQFLFDDGRVKNFQPLYAAPVAQAQHSVPELLARAEDFVSGFEDDDEQEGVSQLLADLRLAIGRVK